MCSTSYEILSLLKCFQKIVFKIGLLTPDIRLTQSLFFYVFPKLLGTHNNMDYYYE